MLLRTRHRATVTTVAIVVAAGVIAAAQILTAARAQQEKASVPLLHPFDGLVNTSFKTTEGKSIPVFINGYADDFQALNRKGSSRDEMLAALATEGADLNKWLDIPQTVYEFQSALYINKKRVDTYLIMVAFPRPGIKGSKEFKTPLTFSPGGVTTLPDLVAKFGEANGTQMWSAEYTRAIGLDGMVHWWGEVGAAAAADGSITHVLLRAVAKSK